MDSRSKRYRKGDSSRGIKRAGQGPCPGSNSGLDKRRASEKIKAMKGTRQILQLCWAAGGAKSSGVGRALVVKAIKLFYLHIGGRSKSEVGKL